MLTLTTLRLSLSRPRWMAAALISAALVASPVAHASDWTPLLGSGAGAAAGAVLGQSVGGKSGAVIGGALGGAAGAAVTSHGRHQNNAIIGGAVGGATGAAVGQSVGGTSGAIVGAGLGGAAGTGIARNLGGRPEPERRFEGPGRGEHAYHTSYRRGDERHGRMFDKHHRHHGHPGKGRGHDRHRD